MSAQRSNSNTVWFTYIYIEAQVGDAPNKYQFYLTPSEPRGATRENHISIPASVCNQILKCLDVFY